MANTMPTPVNDFCFVNSLQATASMGGGDTLLTAPQNYTSITAMRAFLNGFDPVTYSNANLDILSTNDMVFAIRNIQDSTSIANYIPAQVAQP